MKQKLLLICFLVINLASAQERFIHGGIIYETTSSTTVKISDNQCYSGALIIPSTVVNGSVTYSVTSIENYAFYDCTSLTSIKIPNSVISIGNYAFYKCINLISVIIPDSVLSIGNYAFFGCKGLSTVKLSNNVLSLGNGIFRDCSALTSIIIPDSVTELGDNAFNGCTSLTSAIIGKSVTSLKNFVFQSCSALTSIVIPDSVTAIGVLAFYDCSALTSITIPKSVTSIGTSFLSNCTSLNLIICDIETPIEMEITHFMYVNMSKCILKVPESSIEAYKAAGGWGQIRTIVKKETLSTDTFVNPKSILYPNPFSNELFLELNNDSTTEVEVLDLNGKVLLSKTANTIKNKFDTGNLASGMYLVKISSENNTSVQKMIKK